MQVVMGILSLIPLSASLFTVVRGARRHLPDMVGAIGIDNQLRYLAGVYFGFAVLIWYVIPRVQHHRTLVTFIAGSVFIGGLGRLVSTLQYGAPGGLQITFLVLELAMPLMVLWHRLAFPRPSDPGAPQAAAA